MLSLLWSIVLLLACSSVQSPNTSFFPEVDFAAKCVDVNVDQPSSISQLLFPLGNAESSDMKRQLGSTRLYVGATDMNMGGVPHVAFNIGARLKELVSKHIYK